MIQFRCKCGRPITVLRHPNGKYYCWCSICQVDYLHGETPEDAVETYKQKWGGWSPDSKEEDEWVKAHPRKSRIVHKFRNGESHSFSAYHFHRR